MLEGPEGAGPEMTPPTQRDQLGAVEVKWTGTASAIHGNHIGASNWWSTTNNAAAALMDN